MQRDSRKKCKYMIRVDFRVLNQVEDSSINSRVEYHESFSERPLVKRPMTNQLWYCIPRDSCLVRSDKTLHFRVRICL